MPIPRLRACGRSWSQQAGRADRCGWPVRRLAGQGFSDWSHRRGEPTRHVAGSGERHAPQDGSLRQSHRWRRATRHIIDGRKPHSILNEIFTTDGIGTMVVPEDGIEMRSSYGN